MLFLSVEYFFLEDTVYAFRFINTPLLPRFPSRPLSRGEFSGSPLFVCGGKKVNHIV